MWNDLFYFLFIWFKKCFFKEHYFLLRKHSLMRSPKLNKQTNHTIDQHVFYYLQGTESPTAAAINPCEPENPCGDGVCQRSDDGGSGYTCQCNEPDYEWCADLKGKLLTN